MPPCARVPSECVSDRGLMPPCAHGSSLSPTSQSCLRHRACTAPAVRTANHESRITAVQGGRAVPALPCAGGHPPQRPPEAMPPCARVPPCAHGSSLSPTSQSCLRQSRRITNHVMPGRSGRSGPPLCGGTPPATPPRSYATMRARPHLVCWRPGSNATVPARPQLVASRSPVRPAPTVPTVPSVPSTATGHWQLSTIHCSAAVPLFPARDSETCYTAGSNPNTTRLGPERAACAQLPVHPRPPTMSTSSELNVRTLPPANIAPGAAATTPKCTAQPSAAPPTRSGKKPALPPMPAPPPPGAVSCHENHAAVTILRTSCTQKDIVLRVLTTKRPRNADIRIL